MDASEGADHVHGSSRCQCRPPLRKSHKKSRNGCRTCKRRRIKCDETKPSCKNCSRCELPCDFNTDDAAALAGSGTSSAAAQAPRKRGRPMKKWTTSPAPPSTDPAESEQPAAAAVDPPVSQREPPGRLPQPLNVDDLYLFYHYLGDASLTLGDDVLWRDKVPRFAFEHPFILHLLLAISALHLARVRVSEAGTYERLAEAHFMTALPEVTGMLPRIRRDNCSALYIATVLVCNYTFAKTPKKGHLVVVAEGAEVAWWTLFRGVRFVIETMGLPAIFSGRLGPFPPENTTKIPPAEGEGGYIPWEEPLDKLTRLVSSRSSPELENLEAIREALVDVFREVYGTAEQPEEQTHGKMHVVMRWLWFLEDDFVNQVKDKVAPALVLLAHFAVLLQTLECFWFMRGWAHHVMDGIVEHLDSDHVVWVFWPMQQIGWRCNDGLLALH